MTTRLNVTGAENGEFEFEFEHELLIGRDPASCRLVLTGDTQVSRVHARIFRENDLVMVEDRGSRNGTYLNGQKLEGPKETGPDDLVMVGQTQICRIIAADVFDPGSTQLGPRAAPKVAHDGDMTILASRDALFDPMTVETQSNDASELQKVNARLRILHTITLDFSTIRPIVSLLSDTLERIFEIMPVEQGIILLKTNDGTFKLAARKSRDPNDTGEIKVSRTILRHVLEKRQEILTPDASKETNFNAGQSVMLHQIRAVACVPMVIRKKAVQQEVSEIVGILQVYSTDASSIMTQADLDLLLAIGSITAMAIENARLVDQLLVEREKRTNLGRYLDKRVVEQILNNKVEIKLGGETKRITVLFSDIRGFTGMTSRLGAQEIVNTLNAYFSRMVSIIFSQNGTLDKFVGDAIMAIWGAPVLERNCDLQAVTAAVLMQRELNLINILRRSKRQSPLYMGIGLNTGEAVVGNMGSMQAMQYTAMGNTVNLAARIEGKTDKHMVLISKDTLEGVKEHIVVTEIPPVELKGIEGRVPVFAVTGLRSDPFDGLVSDRTYAGGVDLLLLMYHKKSKREIWVKTVDVEDGKLAFAMRPEDIEGISFGDSICVEVPVLDGSENHSKLKLQVGKIEAGDGFASFQVRFQRTTESTTPIPRELLEEALWQDPESD